MLVTFRTIRTITYCILLSLLLFGCQEKKKIRGGSCKTDDDCLKGWICDEMFCTKGERSAAELAERERKKKAEAEAEKKAREAKKRETKSGEGRLTFRLCPFFKNTFESVGSIVAVHRKTKERHVKTLQMEVPKDNMQDVFTFYSLPLGEYEVYAKYGIQVNGKYDTHKLKCDPKGKHRDCEKGELRIAEVVLPKDEKKVEGKVPCDWIAE